MTRNLRGPQAEGSGRHRRDRRHVELLGEKRRGKRTIIVRSESGIEREHLVVARQALAVHAGDFVRAGEALVDGPLVPHDILRISGEEAVQQYLTSRNPERLSQPARRNRRQAHRDHRRADAAKVQIESAGDTSFAAGQRAWTSSSSAR